MQLICPICFCKCQKQFPHEVAYNMSCDMRKPDFCICENKDADQLRGNREADQRLCFRYTDSTIPLLSKSEISSFWPSSVAVQPDFCQTWSETPKTGFPTTRLIYPHNKKLSRFYDFFPMCPNFIICVPKSFCAPPPPPPPPKKSKFFQYVYVTGLLSGLLHW